MLCSCLVGSKLPQVFFATGCFDSVFRVLIALLCFLWVGDFSRVESRVFEMGMLCSDCWFFSSMQIPLQSF